MPSPIARLAQGHMWLWVRAGFSARAMAMTSMENWWLETTMKGPERGTFSTPVHPQPVFSCSWPMTAKTGLSSTYLHHMCVPLR